MSTETLNGILLRRIDYGDWDYILTFLTDDRGKITVIAKNAKKSIRRFFGMLELFSHVNMTVTDNRKKGMTVLKETTLEHPFEYIREDIFATAYASYWSEITNLFLEEDVKQEKLYRLFLYILEALDNDRQAGPRLSLLFQIKFLEIAGLSPMLSLCNNCRKDLEDISETTLCFDLAKGGIVCRECNAPSETHVPLSKGTVKQLIWLLSHEFKTAGRIKYSPSAITEGLNFLERFVPYHLGKEPKSLKFLKQIR